MQWVTTLESVDFPSNRRISLPLLGVDLKSPHFRQLLADKLRSLILERLEEIPQIEGAELRMRLWVRPAKDIPRPDQLPPEAATPPEASKPAEVPVDSPPPASLPRQKNKTRSASSKKEMSK